jgi:hypothetical protein
MDKQSVKVRPLNNIFVPIPISASATYTPTAHIPLRDKYNFTRVMGSLNSYSYGHVVVRDEAGRSTTKILCSIQLVGLYVGGLRRFKRGMLVSASIARRWWGRLPNVTVKNASRSSRLYLMAYYWNAGEVLFMIDARRTYLYMLRSMLLSEFNVLLLSRDFKPFLWYKTRFVSRILNPQDYKLFWKTTY